MAMRKRSSPDEQMARILAAVAARDVFLKRAQEVESLGELTTLMVEAIDMHFRANGLEVVGRDGRHRVSMEGIAASHCLKATRDRYAMLCQAIELRQRGNENG